MTTLLLAAIGLIFGSFAGAQVWRLRARQLIADKQAGEPYDKAEYKRLQELTKHSGAADRSRCLECHHRLQWYDLLPLVSWLSTNGSCRYCHKKIGWFEPLIELGTAVFFVVSYLAWPVALETALSIGMFVGWLVAGVLLAILCAYDAKWFLLPNKVTYPLTVVAFVVAVLHVISAPHTGQALLSLGMALIILSGLYLVIWLLSKGRWIGFGDVKLGLALALLLSSWELAFIALFAANLIGCLIVIPGMASGKITRQTRIPFGPLLIVGTVIAMLWGSAVTTWYLSFLV